MSIELEIRDKTALMTLRRPEVLNSLNLETLREIERLFSDLAGNAEVGAVIVTGAGEKAFAAGADIREFAEMSPLEARRRSLYGQSVFGSLAAFPKPVLAAVNGFCLGGGCELALACHLRVASDQARFGLPEVKLGLIPGYGGTQRLARLVGKGRALELILSGEMIDAEQAGRIGLVNRVVAAADLLPVCLEMTSKMVSNAPVAVRYALEAVRAGADMPLPQALALEASLFGLTFATEDRKEGIEAFLKKRAPSFRGR